jgi:hypothetical protein
MTQKTIRSAGNVITFPTFSDGLGKRVTREFLDQIIVEFARQCEKYMTITGEAPFAYRERQLHSFIAPALSKCLEIFLMEAPVNRKWSEQDIQQPDSHGWVDYWCYLRNIVLLIELKHTFCSFRSGKPTKDLQAAWQKAIHQLDAIKQEALTQSEWSKGSVRIALHVIPIYKSFLEEQPENTDDERLLLQIKDRIIETLKPKPNWSGLWILRKNLVGPYEYTKRKEVYPAVLFVAYVYDMITS